MIDSTNPRVMADNIRHQGNAITTQENAITALGTYSEDELDTGMKFGAASIYRKVIMISELPNATTATYPHNISNIDKILSITGALQMVGNSPAKIFGGAGTGLTYVGVGRSGITVTSNADLSGVSAIVTLEYTKTVPEPESLTSPSPEDETRSVEDPEISDSIEIIDVPIQEVKKTTRKKSTN